MEVEQLEQKKLEIESTFKALETEKQELIDKTNKINTEQVKLQGAYDLLDEQIKNFKKGKK